jgi:acetyl esterase
MTLDPRAKRLLDIIAATGTAVGQPTPQAMRRMINELAQVADARDVPIWTTEDRDIPGPGGPLLIRIYTPLPPSAGQLPALIYLHGGTGVFCSIETHDGLCRLLANASGCRVISVDYRLAPEHRFPSSLEDSREAARWTFAHCAELGIDPRRIAIGGDSAGATLATTVCRLERSSGLKFALQVLLCPVTDIRADTGSRRLFSRGYFFDIAMLSWSLEHYLPDGIGALDPRLSPLRSKDLRGLPPTHIHTAEFDPFRDEGEAYAEALRCAGVPVRRCCHDGMIHHFYCLAGFIPRSRQVIKLIGEAISEALTDPQRCHITTQGPGFGTAPFRPPRTDIG